MARSGRQPRRDGGERARLGPRPPRDELAEGTAHGDVYLRRLIRAQLTLSLRAVAAFGGIVGSLPLLFLLAPGLADVGVLGVPLPVLVLAVPIFPAIVVIGLLYQRRADALDDGFRELVEDD